MKRFESRADSADVAVELLEERRGGDAVKFRQLATRTGDAEDDARALREQLQAITTQKHKLASAVLDLQTKLRYVTGVADGHGHDLARLRETLFTQRAAAQMAESIPQIAPAQTFSTASAASLLPSLASVAEVTHPTLVRNPSSMCEWGAGGRRAV